MISALLDSKTIPCEPYHNPDVGVDIDTVRVYAIDWRGNDKPHGVYIFGEVAPHGITPKMIPLLGPIEADSLDMETVANEAVANWRASL